MGSPAIRTVSCGCCTNGCICHFHQDISRGRRACVCDHHKAEGGHPGVTSPIDDMDDYDARHRCRCGSGKQRFDIVDAAGIFCTFACDDCEAEKRKKFNPSIFDGRSTYAATGEEDDIGRYAGEDY